MALFRERDNKISDEIPTSSMADIAFLLIIYFMVTTTFSATRGLDFALPDDEDNPPVVEKVESVLIQIQPGGAILVDNKPMRLDDIWPYLEPKLERNPEKPIIIQPDPQAAYGDMVTVFDHLRVIEEQQDVVEKLNIAIPTRREIEAFWY